MMRPRGLFLSVSFLGLALSLFGAGCSQSGDDAAGQKIELPPGTQPAAPVDPAKAGPVDPNTSQGAPNTP